MISEEYLKRMQDMLKEEYPAYLASLEQPHQRGFRYNLLKTDEEEIFNLTGFAKRPSPFASNGFLLEDEKAVGAMWQHAAGLIYLQEPSASAAVTVLDPRPGMKILDLCAAPGSKSTEIAERMGNEGLLVCNEIDPKRCQILRENIERYGCANVMVLNEDPRNIARDFAGYFDMVLVDAPCSGEGMFRKHEKAVENWSLENVLACARRQKHILASAYACLKKCGRMVYSTCTFSREENEENMVWFKTEYPDIKIQHVDAAFGRHGFDLGNNTAECLRIFPMEGGDGHFICLLKKEGEEEGTRLPLLESDAIPKEAGQFLKEHKVSYPYLYVHQDKVYGGTYPFITAGHCHLIRHQVLLGTMKNHRFEPSHAMYLSSFCTPVPSVEITEQQADAYMHGMTINEKAQKGECAVCVRGHCIGYAKSDGTILKNKYPKAQRLQ